MRKRLIPGVIGAGFLGGLIWWLGGSQPPAPPPQPQPPTNPVPAPGDFSGLVDAHNVERSRVGAPALRGSTPLNNAAQKHADWMAQNKKMSHTGAGGSSFADRIRAEGYTLRTGGENIANGYRTVPDVMRGWMNSSGHKANILNPNFRAIGVGRTGNYWCTVFATPWTGTGQPLVVIEEQPDGISWEEFP